MLLFILLIIAGLKIYSTAQPSPSIISLPQPQISSLPEAPANLQYSFEKNWPDFPEELPVYKIVEAPAFSLVEMKKIAGYLGFKEEPTAAKDIETGTFYNWSNNESYLAIGGVPPAVSFGLLTLENVSTPSAGISQTEAVKLSKKILEEMGLANSLIDINRPVFKTDSSVIAVSYQYSLPDAPILNNNPTNPPISLSFDSRGKLIKMDYIKYPPEFEKDKTAALLSKDQALKNLEEQKGAVIYFADAENKNLDIPVNYQVSLSQIEKVSLAYYYPAVSSKTDLVLPYFVFEGKGVDARTGKPVKIITLLPAIR